MMQVLSPTYTLRVEVQDKMRGPQTIFTRADTEAIIAGVHVPTPTPPEPYFKYFDGPTGKTGCDEVLAAVKDALHKAGLTNITVSLERFEHR